MNWNARYAEKRKWLDMGLPDPPKITKPVLGIPTEPYNSRRPWSENPIPREHMPYWNLVFGKLSSEATPARSRTEMLPNLSGTPLHKLRAVFNARAAQGFTQKQMDGGPLMGPLYAQDRMVEHLRSTIVPAEGNPDYMVRIYRAVPKGVDTIYRGDQVTTNPDRAVHVAVRADGMDYTTHPDDKSMHILCAMVPAKHLISAVGGPRLQSEYDPDHVTRWADFAYVPGGNE